MYDHLACKVVRVDWILESKLNGSSLVNSSPGSTQTRQTSNKDTINHVQGSNNRMLGWYVMRDAMQDAYARFDKESMNLASTWKYKNLASTWKSKYATGKMR